MALQLINGIPRVRRITSTYDQTYEIPNGGITSGSNITLPASGTYTDTDLEVTLNGQFLEVGVDYSYVGSAPRTQIQTIIDLYAGERLRFKVNI